MVGLRRPTNPVSPHDTVTIRPFHRADFEAVVVLWARAGLTLGPSETEEGIQRKLERDPHLFLVAESAGGHIDGAVLGAFDGRRGWIYHLAVSEERQGKGLGTALLVEVEARLRAIGCVKVNLLVSAENMRVIPFYERVGYGRHEVVFMEKWLEDTAATQDAVGGGAEAAR